jgi:CRP-like cAMP-binding protein
MAVAAHRVRPKNKILAALTPDEFERLSPHMETVHIPQSKVLYEAGESINNLYFPNSGMLSLLSMSEDGATIEVGMVGTEGVVGIPVVLEISTTPYAAMAQLASNVIRIKGTAIKTEFSRCGRLNHLLLRYTHVLLMQTAQSVVCNRFHTIEKRLCRWLLVAHDLVDRDTLHLTQEIIAHMLGISRTGVTMAAMSLQRASLIRYSRGRIEILNRKAMEATSCPCYKIIKEEFERYIDR